MAPSPKEEKILLFSDSVVCFDDIGCKLFNYEPKNFKLLDQNRIRGLKTDDEPTVVVFCDGKGKLTICLPFILIILGLWKSIQIGIVLLERLWPNVQREE